MRKGLPVACLVAGLLALPAPGSASELLDLLKQKGVISEEEYRRLKGVEEREKAKAAEAMEKAKLPFDISYKPAGGLQITSKDKQHQLSFGVQVFTQLSLFSEDTDADSNFLARRGRVSFGGYVFRDFTYKLELDGTSSPVLDEDAFLGWERYKQLRIRVGQHKTRFGGEQTWGRYSLFFLERSMISDVLAEGGSRGAFVYGDLHPAFSYQASVSNGTGRASDNNDDKDFALRLIAKPFQGSALEKALPIEVAGNVAVGEQPHSSTGGRVQLFLRDNRLTMFSVATEGMRTRWGGDIWYNKDYKQKGNPFSATAELIYEKQEREGPVLGTGSDDLVRWGYHVQAGYLLTGTREKDGWELVAKYESIDMDDDDKSGGDNIVGQTVDTWGFGLNYWPVKQVRLSVNGFVFDIDRPLTSAAADDPFNNGSSAWAVVSGFYFRF
ncbi:MAG: hypothetical protein HYY21_11085 [Candidatus Tectomicrobia bacterium]|nr:hypothetical protein [Candidatus Tectomicrobia bacterium]